MDQFRQIGEVLGSLKALMVLKHDISINQKQCCLLLNLYTLAFETISEEIRKNLRLEDKNIKWKALEYPLKELHRILKEGENYVRYCMDIRDWWGKAISLHQNKECVEFHIHNLLCCFPVVIEAIETAAEISALDEDDMQKRRLMITRKYDIEWNDPKFFYWKFGKQYLVPREICKSLEIAAREDKWLLLQRVEEKKISDVMAKHEQKLKEFLISQLSGSELSEAELLPSWILVESGDYRVKRRLGTGKSHIKEISWLGEKFALRNFFGEIEPLDKEISLVLSLSHPSIMQYHCAFYDEEKKEGYLIMELMQKNLEIYIKENCGQRKRVPFSIPIAVDIMLQIARGMEYLHSQKIYHGDLNPSNILLKPRSSTTECYFQAKVTGFGITSIKSYIYRTNSANQNGVDSLIWYAPEVLAEQEQPGSKGSSKYTEKADIYSFGMLCFELLTGKVPFEDENLQGDKMARNIRLGVRPLFPHPTPKYLVNVLKKCWQSKPSNRPSFSSICRILRYIKKVLVIDPDHGQPDAPPPLVDYCDIEAGYSKKFPEEGSSYLMPVSQISFQMFAYKLLEKEKTSGSFKGKSWDVASEAFLVGENGSILGDEDYLFMEENDHRSVQSEFLQRKKSVSDLRSVFSEFPHRKFMSADRTSVRSESPMRKGLPIAEADRSPLFAETPMSLRQKTLSKPIADRKSVTYDIPEKKMLPTNDQKSGCTDNLEKEILTTNESKNEPGSTCLEDQEKTAPSTEVADKGRVCRDTSDEPLSTSMADQKSNPQEATEKMGMQRVATQSSISTTNSDKKVTTRKGTTEQVRHLEIPEKKVLSSTKKLKDTKTSKSQSQLKRYSPRTSPSQNGVSTPWASPARVFKETPKRVPKEYSKSPWSSPARVFKETPKRAPRESSISSPAQGKSKRRSPRTSPTRTTNAGSTPWATPARAYKETPTPWATPARAFKDATTPWASPARVFKEASTPWASPARVFKDNTKRRS